MAADILIRLRKTAEELASVEQYSGYVRMLIEAGAEISRLRRQAREQSEMARLRSKKKGAHGGKGPRVRSETESEGFA